MRVLDNIDIVSRLRHHAATLYKLSQLNTALLDQFSGLDREVLETAIGAGPRPAGVLNGMSTVQ